MADPGVGFGPAAREERCVFGARRPGYPSPRVPAGEVDEWISFIRSKGIRRVVCLLSRGELEQYDDLQRAYESAFGAANVLMAPVDDFRLADTGLLVGRVLPFLAESDLSGRMAVVHCAGGSGRTGQVLAAWLTAFRGMSNHEALAAVRATGRNPEESGDPGLGRLLDDCRTARPGKTGKGPERKEDTMCDEVRHHHHCGFHGTASLGSLWLIGWLFTLGFLHLPFLKALLGLLVWPYFIGSALRLPGL